MTLKQYSLFDQSLKGISPKKQLIFTLNAYCYNLTLGNAYYREALQKSDILIPDGISIVWSIRWLTGKKLRKIAGADLFCYEMKRMQKEKVEGKGVGGRVFFLGSSKETLAKIKARAGKEFPLVQVKTYSPPYKPEFTAEENETMLKCINAFKPDVLFVGMTAPKQEKWAYQHFNQLEAGHVCCIGAVFDFYAGTINRAPIWMINLGLEWLFRFIKEPIRMWKRYLIGNIKFIWYVFREKFGF